MLKQMGNAKIEAFRKEHMAERAELAEMGNRMLCVGMIDGVERVA